MNHEKWYFETKWLIVIFFSINAFFAPFQDARKERQHNEDNENQLKESKRRVNEFEQRGLSWVQKILPEELTGKGTQYVPHEYRDYCQGKAVQVIDISGGMVDAFDLAYSGHLLAGTEKYRFHIVIDAGTVHFPSDPEIQRLSIYHADD